MNKVILMGRLTRDPEVRYSQGEQHQQSQDIHWQLTADSSVMEIRPQTLSDVWHSVNLVNLQRSISAKEQRLS